MRDEKNIKFSNTVSTIGNVSNENSSKSSTALALNHRIVGIAVCSTHQTSSNKSQDIYVTCITDSKNSVGVTVHQNPHLHLNGLSALEASSSTNHNRNDNASCMDAPNAKFTLKVEVCQPNLPFDYINRGNPRCIDISHKRGVVVVGTEIGMLLVYKFNIPRMVNAVVGKNETNEMNLAHTFTRYSYIM